MVYFRPMQESLHDVNIVPIGVGYYTAGEAARLLKTPPRNIARWLGGYSYKSRDGNTIKTTPLWMPQLPRLGDSLEIEFRDLIELRFVLAFMKQGVGLNVIRRCLDNARKIIGEERPFSTHEFRTDGKSIFLESLREEEEPAKRGAPAVVDLKTSQMVFKQVVEPTFRDLDLADGSVAQWRPFNGKRSIVIDPQRSFGKPIATDYGVPTSALANAVKAENSVRRVASLFEVPVAVVNDAIAFERSLMAA
jgi:uncharacterized protein (DUF433 family)